MCSFLRFCRWQAGTLSFTTLVLGGNTKGEMCQCSLAVEEVVVRAKTKKRRAPPSASLLTSMRHSVGTRLSPGNQNFPLMVLLKTKRSSIWKRVKWQEEGQRSERRAEREHVIRWGQRRRLCLYAPILTQKPFLIAETFKSISWLRGNDSFQVYLLCLFPAYWDCWWNRWHRPGEVYISSAPNAERERNSKLKVLFQSLAPPATTNKAKLLCLPTRCMCSALRW